MRSLEIWVNIVTAVIVLRVLSALWYHAALKFRKNDENFEIFDQAKVRKKALEEFKRYKESIDAKTTDR